MMTKVNILQCSKLKMIGGRQNRKRGVQGSSPEKNVKFKVAEPLKFHSQSLSYSTENCRRPFPVRTIFTSVMTLTLKVKNKTWISNFQVHMKAETNLSFKFMFKISPSASTEKS